MFREAKRWAWMRITAKEGGGKQKERHKARITARHGTHLSRIQSQSVQYTYMCLSSHMCRCSTHTLACPVPKHVHTRTKAISLCCLGPPRPSSSFSIFAPPHVIGLNTHASTTRTYALAHLHTPSHRTAFNGCPSLLLPRSIPPAPATYPPSLPPSPRSSASTPPSVNRPGITAACATAS